MRVGFFTIVLNGMPFIEHHIKTFEKLEFPWCWSVVDGAAGNIGDTAWCKRQIATCSTDGTIEYLKSLDPGKVHLVSKSSWINKTEMVNEAIKHLDKEEILIEIDVDEFHSVENLTTIFQLLSTRGFRKISLPCRYFVGPDLVCDGDDCWSNRGDEWCRAWRRSLSDYFMTHEPPNLRSRLKGLVMNRQDARKIGLTFDHFAYATLKQVEYKERFYGYTGLVNQWKALQNYKNFPVALQRFFPFVDNKVTVKRLDPSDVPALIKTCCI